MVMLGVSLAMDGSIESFLSASSCAVSVWAPVHSPSSAAIKSHMSSFLSRSAPMRRWLAHHLFMGRCRSTDSCGWLRWSFTCRIIEPSWFAGPAWVLLYV